MACETLLTATGSAITLARLSFWASSGLGTWPAPLASSAARVPAPSEAVAAPLSSWAAPSSSFCAPSASFAAPSRALCCPAARVAAPPDSWSAPVEAWLMAPLRAGVAAGQPGRAGADGSGPVRQLLDLRCRGLEGGRRARRTPGGAALASKSARIASAWAWVMAPAATSRLLDATTRLRCAWAAACSEAASWPARPCTLVLSAALPAATCAAPSASARVSAGRVAVLSLSWVSPPLSWPAPRAEGVGAVPELELAVVELAAPVLRSPVPWCRVTVPSWRLATPSASCPAPSAALSIWEWMVPKPVRSWLAVSSPTSLATVVCTAVVSLSTMVLSR